MTKHSVINLGIGNLRAWYILFQEKPRPLWVNTELSNFNNLPKWVEFHPRKKSLNMFMIENKK
jgi:hypothetical protein